jgi:hypothetical protein
MSTSITLILLHVFTMRVEKTLPYSILFFPIHVDLASGLHPSCFPTKILYALISTNFMCNLYFDRVNISKNI